MKEIYFCYAAITLITIIGVLALRATYRNGVCDGYGFGREPKNPGYRKAGNYLKEYMTHRWPEIEWLATLDLNQTVRTATEAEMRDKDTWKSPISGMMKQTKTPEQLAKTARGVLLPMADLKEFYPVCGKPYLNRRGQYAPCAEQAGHKGNCGGPEPPDGEKP
jgi:hypothetical protein